MQSSSLMSMYPNITNLVPGEGDPNADILFIGEAPGKDEDVQGRPFVGRAGKLLNELLEKAGLKREEVFITNIVKIRPPDNRDPRPEEKDAWYPYLERQIKVIKPLVIATLGRHSMGRFLPNVSISKEHGKPKRINGIWSNHQVFMPLYHPAVGLYNPNERETMIKDIKKLKALLKKIKDEKLYE